jgi:uncharacterized protein YciI
MADRYFVVTRARGPAWDHGRSRREQRGWDAHAAFMDALTEAGVVVLGGPLGEGDGHDALLVLDVADEAAAHERLAGDPWEGDLLTTSRAEPWTVLLRRP